MTPGSTAFTRRIAVATLLSLLLHAAILWWPDIRLPQPEPQLPPLAARLEKLPAPAPKPRPKPRPEPPQPADQAPPRAEETAPAEPPAASAPIEPPPPEQLPEQLPEQATGQAAGRPPLPRRARLHFAIHLGENGLRVGETIHTLEIDDGHYVLQAVTRTVGLVRLFRSYELTQYSSGSYGRRGLLPQQFFEERKDKGAIHRTAVTLDHAAGLARHAEGGESTLPPDTQDILSIMYQFPPLSNARTAALSVSNGRKIEQYEFDVVVDEEIETPYGKLLAVRLSKVHGANEEGLEIWLAREYRLFPVKLRFIEKDGKIAAEALVTDIRVSEEEGVRTNAVD